MKYYKLLLFALLWAGVSAGANFKDGVAAYDRFDYAKAKEIWLPLAEAGDAKSQYNLGVMQEQGYGQKADAKAALRWYKKAAKSGYTEAQYRAGNAYYFGKGTKKDLAQAKQLWEQAAASNHISSQYNLGVLFMYSGARYRDVGMAKKWLQKAAEQGHKGAENLLTDLGGVRAKVASPQQAQKTAQAKTPPAQKISQAPIIPTLKVPDPVQTKAAKPNSAQTNAAKPGTTQAKTTKPTVSSKKTLAKKDWIARQEKQHYTVQLIVLASRSQAQAFIRKHALQGKAYAYQLKGSKLVKVIYGSYASRAKASKAINGLPKVLRKDGPWPKKFALVHAERGK